MRCKKRAENQVPLREGEATKWQGEKKLKGEITNKEKNMSLDYNKNLIPNAKQLRKNATKEENHLWYDFLKNYPLRFQRQKTIGHYIVDFYCHKAKLVIELDGSQHYTPEGLAYDNLRTEVLQQYELEVMRFTNKEIWDNFVGVCQEIDNKIKEKL